jgi:hypothetical protein
MNRTLFSMLTHVDSKNLHHSRVEYESEARAPKAGHAPLIGSRRLGWLILAIVVVGFVGLGGASLYWITGRESTVHPHDIRPERL